LNRRLLDSTNAFAAFWLVGVSAGVLSLKFYKELFFGFVTGHDFSRAAKKEVPGWTFRKPSICFTQVNPTGCG
jgi:hypothetical protein